MNDEISIEEMQCLIRLSKLTKLIRTQILYLEAGDIDRADSVIEALKAGGLISGQHIGLSPLGVIEWYGGQIISILENKTWYAVNSLINCVDKFAPEIK